MPKKYTSGDRNASRTAMPGTKRQTPVTTSTVRTPSGKKVADVKMNYKGIAGGLPTTDSGELRKRASAAKSQGATSSAKAASMRADNLDGHAKMDMANRSAISAAKSRARLSEYKTTARRK